MLKKISCYVLLCLLMGKSHAESLSISQHGANCQLPTIDTLQGLRLALKQEQMQDGRFELVLHAIGSGEEQNVRLSFGGSKEPRCHFLDAKIEKGGDWGWHIAWSSDQKPGVYFVRVDANAWVSSVPKRITPNPSQQVYLKVSGADLVVEFWDDRSSDTRQIALSHDEGRTWELP